MYFSIFIGIDQTGAVQKNGKPKPLTVTLIDARKKKITICSKLTLSNLNQKSVFELIRNNISGFTNEKVLICIDTVFGLPNTLQTTPHTVFQLIKNYEFAGKPYGAVTAFEFFRQFLGPGTLPQRLVETRVKANSVFLMKPYQRNIGCGSYRVIKELAQDKKWFSLWPFEKPSSQFVILEGYPTYFWKHFLDSTRRNLDIIHKQFPDLQFSNVDQADSFMLAYGAMKSISQLSEPNVPEIARNEGWIFGVPFNEPVKD